MRKRQREELTMLDPPDAMLDNCRAVYGSRSREYILQELGRTDERMDVLMRATRCGTDVEASDEGGLTGDYGERKEQMTAEVAKIQVFNEILERLDADESKSKADEADEAEGQFGADSVRGIAESVIPVASSPARRKVQRAIDAVGGTAVDAMAAAFAAKIGEFAGRQIPVGTGVDVSEVFGDVALGDQAFLNAVHETTATTAGMPPLAVPTDIFGTDVPKRETFVAGLFGRRAHTGDGNALVYRVQTGPAAQVSSKGKKQPSSDANLADDAYLAPLVDWLWDERTANIRASAIAFDLSMEQREDVGGIAQLLRSLAIEDLMRRMDEQILGGDNVAPNIMGVLNFTNIGSFADTTTAADLNTEYGAGTFKAGDVTFGYDMLRRRQTKIRLEGRTRANFCIMHPHDLDTMLFTKDNENRPVFDALRMSAAMGRRPMAWGIGIYDSDVIAQGTVCQGNSRFADVVTKGGIGIEVSNSDDKKLRALVQTVVLYNRYTLIPTRDKAFDKLTSFKPGKNVLT